MKDFIFDLDGTIIKNGQPLSGEMLLALENISRHNNIVFASARPVRDMLPLLPESLHHHVMIGCNGSMAWKSGECLFSQNFSGHELSGLLELLVQQQVPYLLDGNWNYSVSAKSHPFHDYIRSLTPCETHQQSVVDEGVTKILVLDNKFQETASRFMLEQGSHSIIYHHRNEDIFDITPASNNKYAALQKLGIAVDHAWVFGNDNNDFTMLNHAGYSVFLGEPRLFDNASHYCAIDELPSFINTLSEKAHSLVAN